MTETQWLAETKRADELLLYLREQALARTRAGKRLFRLFGCGCCRRLWRLLDDDSRRTVEAGERWADGLLGPDEQVRVEREAIQKQYAGVMNAQTGEAQNWCALTLVCRAVQSGSTSVLALGIAGMAPQAAAVEAVRREMAATQEQVRERWMTAWTAEVRGVCELVRDVFGNPFRPLPRRSFSAHVRGLAQACYAGDVGLLPVLADALADLGEEAAASHCRQGMHVKGCHVIDWARE
jgi:hypothetical protein